MSGMPPPHVDATNWAKKDTFFFIALCTDSIDLIQIIRLREINQIKRVNSSSDYELSVQRRENTGVFFAKLVASTWGASRS